MATPPRQNLRTRAKVDELSALVNEWVRRGLTGGDPADAVLARQISERIEELASLPPLLSGTNYIAAWAVVIQRMRTFAPLLLTGDHIMAVAAYQRVEAALADLLAGRTQPDDDDE